MDLTEINERNKGKEPVRSLKINNVNFKKYEAKISNLETQFFSLLDDFQKYYIFYNKNPENDEYQKMYSDIKGNVQSSISELFSITNNIELNTETVNNDIQRVKASLDSEKETNTNLKKRIGYMDGVTQSSVILNETTGELNTDQYVFIIAMVIGILGILFTLYYVYVKNKL
jgi:predicted DNA-binding ArsR family transcriptional regulator